MSIMDHFGYTTRPLVEFNLSIYTERASFLGWLSHMSERKRLAITLDPASSEPARFKNKRVQASGDMIREESEPEVVPINPPFTSKSSSTAVKSSKSLQALNNQPTRTASREAERKRGADSEDDYKPPTKKTKVKSKRSSSRSKAGKKPNTSAYGRVTDVGGKCPKCCDIGQIDRFFIIELFPLSSLSSDNTNCKNDIQLFHQLFDELSVYRDYH